MVIEKYRRHAYVESFLVQAEPISNSPMVHRCKGCVNLYTALIESNKICTLFLTLYRMSGRLALIVISKLMSVLQVVAENERIIHF